MPSNDPPQPPGLPGATFRSSRIRAVLGGLAGVVLGAVAFLLLGPADRGGAHANDRPSLDAGKLIDAAHTPPLLTLPGERVELRYDVYCPPPPDAQTDACDATGTVYVRRGDGGAFQAIPLTLDRDTAEGRYVARVPATLSLSAGGFAYYAVVRNRTTGAALTVPSGGAEAPQRSLPLLDPVHIDLDPHVFGETRRASSRVFAGAWGDGPADVGLEGGPESQRVGPSSFDVAADETLTLLDQVHRRALRVRSPGRSPAVVPLGVRGTLADLVVADDGTMWVLETAGPDAPLLRAFTSHGRSEGSVRVADRTASQVRLGSAGPMVKQYPSEQWFPAIGSGGPLPPAAQRTGGEVAQTDGAGRAIVVFRTGNEVRAARVGPNGVRRAWRVHSATPLAEVQLAEPLGEGLLIVVRTYYRGQDEFLVLTLGPQGLRSRFAVDSADWSETAPLSRFRLRGSSLYQLGSSAEGVHVDRFDLEVD